MPNSKFFYTFLNITFVASIVFCDCKLSSSKTVSNEPDVSFSGTQSSDDADKTWFKIKVSAGNIDRKDTIVDVPIWFEGIQFGPIALTDNKGTEIAGQIGEPYYLDLHRHSHKSNPNTDEKIKIPARLIFVLSDLRSRQSITLSARKAKNDRDRRFVWHDDRSTQAELQFDNSPIVRYMYESVDDSSPERRAETYKPYHHVFSPDGKRLLTKGQGGLFPHHRGIFFGFNRISYGDGKQADVWHCNKNESQVCDEAINSATPIYGRSLSSIRWNGQDKNPFAVEQRELIIFKVRNETVIDFRSLLTPLVGPIKFAGDPQHAGVQFRATQEVPDQTKHLTYYVRPDGKGKPGEFRNWSDKPDESEINKSHINLAWHAMVMSLANNDSAETGVDSMDQFTVCCLDSSANPKPARFSERDYGRFGSYFETTIDIKSPLAVHYRYRIAEGELSVAQIKNYSDQFTQPVTVELLK